MTRLYFDVTDVVEFAKRNRTVIGIPRVQLNIISLLAKKSSPGVIRCVFFDTKRRATFEFDPALREDSAEFDGERLLADLGLLKRRRRLPSSVQVKSYLKRFGEQKVLRAWHKLKVYSMALVAPERLKELGLAPTAKAAHHSIPLTRIRHVPSDAIYVCLGAAWRFPEVWKSAIAHRTRGGAVLQMVHDLIPLSYPQYYARREPGEFGAWLDRALEYAACFVCVSQWTAHDLDRYARERGKQPLIKVAKLAHEFAGFDRNARLALPASLEMLAGVKFVLCVGTIEYRKNNLALLEVWKQLMSDGRDIPVLVFAGKYGRGGTELQTALKSDEALSQKVRVVHAPSDHELAWLYQNCLFAAFPSQLEGWGLPVGEAAWFGKLSLTSRATSLPEVCGDLIDYVDPMDIGDIKRGVAKLIADSEYLEQRQRGILAAKLRSWADVADDLYSVAVAARR